jgi:hypothetical protein
VPDRYVLMLLVLVLVSIAPLGLGLVIFFISPTTEQENFLIMPVVLVMFLLAAFLPLDEGSLARPVARLVASRWAFEAMLSVEDDAPNKSIALHLQKYFPESDRFGVESDLLVLGGMVLVMTPFLAMVLKRRDGH